jgi:hypothetical protein
MTVQKSSDDIPSVVEQMAEDATPSTPVAYPPGAPEFKVLLAVRRPQRSEFKLKLADVIGARASAMELRAQSEKAKGDRKQELQMRVWAALDVMYGHIEEALRLVAVDRAKYDTWAESVPDEDLAATFAAYQDRTQPGEASSSAS